jgi:RNA polymerase sigma-70 factor (ECF subfamily)
MDDDATRKLLDAARAGDRAALERLLTRCQERLDALIHSRLGPHLRARVPAADVRQETFLRALRSLERFQWQGEESLLRWLGGIANHVIQEIARREKRELLLPTDDDVAGDEVSASRGARRRERFDRLQAALDGLSADHRRVIILARIEKLPMKEIARRMERSPEAATQLLWRALKKLREAFGSTDSFSLPETELRSDDDEPER